MWVQSLGWQPTLCNIGILCQLINSTCEVLLMVMSNEVTRINPCPSGIRDVLITELFKCYLYRKESLYPQEPLFLYPQEPFMTPFPLFVVLGIYNSILHIYWPYYLLPTSIPLACSAGWACLVRLGLLLILCAITSRFYTQIPCQRSSIKLDYYGPKPN